MKEAVVFFSSAGVSHLTPMVGLAKLFVNHGFLVTVVTCNHPFRPGKADQLVSGLTAAHPTISFHVLPPVTLGDNSANLERFAVQHATLKAQNKNLHDFIIDLSKTSPVRALIIDLFCMVAYEVAEQLSIPGYVFTSFNASTTAFFLSILEFEASKRSVKDFGTNPINLPGLPSLPASEFPLFLLDRECVWYKSFVQDLPSVVKSDGIIMNTFESLEPKAITALREGLCVPGSNMPPIYSIGPLITESQEHETGERHECLKWLDSQPEGTVIFLSFGSKGAFIPDQIKQIAIGLENSCQRFLWVMQVINEPNKMFGDFGSEFELDQVLPEGFLDRTKDRGMVVNTWVPQIQVLHHESVAGFVTHCGWNSILEAVTAGKPMICWPLHSEQRLNKAILADDEMRLAVVMEGYDQDMVEAEEVEAKVRWLIEDEGAELIKERAKEMNVKAMESLSETGSSSQAFVQLLMDIERHKLVKTKT